MQPKQWSPLRPAAERRLRHERVQHRSQHRRRNRQWALLCGLGVRWEDSLQVGLSTLWMLDPETGSSIAIRLASVGPISGLAWCGWQMWGLAGGGSPPTTLYTMDCPTGYVTAR